MATQSNGHTPLRIWTFDNPRSRSHIFYRLFSQHPQLAQLYHPYLSAFFLGPDRIQVHLKHSQSRRKEVDETWAPLYVDDTYDSSRRQLEKDVTEIEKTGRFIWSNEHCSWCLKQHITLNMLRGKQYKPEELVPNPTQLPDWLFATMSPILVIRHPVFVMPSFYATMTAVCAVRPGDEEFLLLSTLRYTRMLFDVFKYLGKDPLIVDGDDTVWRTKEITANLCKALGIDPEGVRDEWEPTPEDQRPKNPVIAGFTKTIHESSGVERSGNKPSQPINMDAEFQKWVERFGEKVACELKEYADDMMPDYEYLVQFKV